MTDKIQIPARIRRVGMIGLGLMGEAIAHNVLTHGFALTVLAHRSRDAVEALVARGAAEAASAEALARDVDVVLISVTGTPQVRDVLVRERGLLAGAHAGLIVVDATTADPEFAQEAATALAARGAQFLDAPVNRTPKEAREGRLNVLVGGAAELVETVRPLFDTFAETVHHLGALGSGYRAKLIHNFVAQANAVVLAEAFGTAAKAGLNLRAFTDLCRLSGAHSRTFDRIVPFVLEGDDSGQQFALRNALKDMRAYTRLAGEYASTAIVAEAARQVYLLATNLGHGDRYVPHLFDVVGELNGVPVRAAS
ncbi:NAD(P)-dependent oxidoreductase [Burkholderia sp. WAC0059]|uniref:NAD(P)-dependent oxidoreductase n=1 Tax=Burkholderia sp. WAC0059 TaxID=2066022 RepID=UPI000C7F06A8|nr:NAD(P)-dependent oxidoreductase [Burkholderia sp. WAC0059]PLZ02354.1 NAD(P)-dependent oxidoreductase [Burkholderia sp. WAC0059]